MQVGLPPSASELFEKGSKHAVENGRILAYGLKGATPTAVQEICETATESYAREILNWPSGRLAKPNIFEVVAQRGNFGDLDECAKHFARQLHDLFEMSPPKEIPLYPHAFVAISAEGANDIVSLVLAYKPNGQWKLEYCSVPVQVELGLSIESLRMGDTTPQSILDQYA